MSRYGKIESVSFGQIDLPLPLSIKLTRQSEALPAAGESDSFATSLQLSQPKIMAEVRVRGTAVAESLTVGDAGTLAFTISPTSEAQRSRRVTMQGAVLCSVELVYEQTSMACAALSFVAAAPDGNQDPVTAEDLP